MDENPYSQFQVHGAPVTTLTTTPSGRIIFAGFQDGKVKLLNLKHGGHRGKDPNRLLNLVDTISVASKEVSSVSINIDGNFNEILISSANHLVQYDYEKNELVRRIVDERSWLAYSASGYLNSDLAAAVDNDNSLRLFDLKSRTNKPVQVFRDSKDTLTCFDYKSLQNWFISCGSNDGNIYSYDLRMGKLVIDELVPSKSRQPLQSQKGILKHPITSLSLSNANDATGQHSKFAIVGSLNNDVALAQLNIDSVFTNSKLFNFVSDYNEHPIQDQFTQLRPVQKFSKSVCDKQYQIETKLFNNDKHVISGSETGEVYIWSMDSDATSANNSSKGKSAEKVLKTFNSYMTTENSSNKLMSNVSYLGSVNSVLAGSGDGKLHLWEDITLR